MAWTRARNPRFYFVHAGTKPRFLAKNGHQKDLEPHFVVLNLDEFSEMEIRPNLGVSCRRLK
jgi:hypothetical protein